MTPFRRRPVIELPAEQTPQMHSTFRVALVLLGAAAFTALFYVWLAIQTGAWQMYVASGSIWVYAVVVLTAAGLARRGRADLGAGLLIGGMLVAIQFSSALLAHLGLPLGLAVVLVTSVIASETLPPSRVSRAMAAAVVAGVLAAALDLRAPFDQLDLPIVTAAAPFIIGTALLFFAAIVVRRYPSYDIRGKLIIVSLAIALAPLAVQAFLNYLSTRATLQETANQTLAAVARQTANTIDTFMRSNLEAVRTEARLPDFVDLLGLPSNERSGSDLAGDALAVLTVLSRRDRDSIVSYALIDRQGRVVASTLADDADLDASGWGYFEIPIQTRQTYASPVEFSPVTGEAYLDFSGPVITEQGDVLGVLRVRYRASILQKLVVQANDLAGQRSFGVLFDEYHLHLAHGVAPEVILKSVAPLAADQLVALRAAGRLPDISDQDLFLDLPDLEQHLSNALAEPFFEATDIATGDQVNQVAVVSMETQPWLVALFQPQQVFLAPANQQLQNTILSGVLISGFVAALAVGVARLVARPITRLTGTARRVAEGDLSVQAQVEASDEIGALATAFNSMTAQLRTLVGSLETQVESRTAQLRASAEVGRAAVSLLDADQLLRTVVNLITDRFGFYYAAVFTLDEAGKFAVLREATGPQNAGRELKERGHQLQAGGRSMVGSAIVQRKPRIALDVGEEAVRFANPLLPATRSEIALPLMVGDRVLGALDVQSTQAAAFDEASAAVLQTMADQIAVALNNAELFRRAERQAATQSDLWAASLELTGHLERDALFHLVARQTMDLLDADGAGIWLPVSEDEIELVTSVNVGQAQLAGRRLVKGQGLSGKVFANERSLRVDDYLAWSGHAASFEDVPFHAAIAVPMMWQGRVFGVLSATQSQPDRKFASDDERTAQLYAAQAAAALAGAELREQQQRTLDELDAINRRLSGEAWAQHFSRLPDAIQQASYARSGQNPIEQTWLPEVEQAVTEKKSVAWSQRQDQIVSSPFQAAMAAPIVLRGEVIGALQVGEASRQRPWSADDLAFIQAVADQVAQAVENARLLDQTQRAAQREKVIAEAADKIHRPIDIDAVLRAALEEVSRVTGSHEVSIQLGVKPVDGNGHTPGSTGGGNG